MRLRWSWLKAQFVLTFFPLGVSGIDAREVAVDDSATVSQERPQFERQPDGRLHFKGVTVDEKTLTVSFPAVVNMRRDLMEYAIVHETGKDHESLFTTKVSPFTLNVALLLTGLKESKEVLTPLYNVAKKSEKALRKPDPAQSHAVVTIRWAEGESEVVQPLEALVLNTKKGKSAVSAPWVYTGSGMTEGVFWAESDGSILALYLDERAILNNPREGHFDDETWSATDLVPEVGTAVTISISPASKTSE